jgi:hypothetical protein
VALGDVEGDEVVEFVFDFGAGGDGEAHSAEEFGQLVCDLGDDVGSADLGFGAGFGDVAVILGGGDVGGEGGLFLFEGLGDFGFDGVDALADGFLFGTMGELDEVCGVFDFAVGAEVADAPLFEVGGGGDLLEVGEGAGAEVVDLGEDVLHCCLKACVGRRRLGGIVSVRAGWSRNCAGRE